MTPEQRQNLSRKDYDDFEFIARDAQEFAALSPQDQIQRLLADPWSAVSGFKDPKGHDFPLSKQAHQRFNQIAARGLKNLGTPAHIHRFERVVDAVKAELSKRILSGLEITAKNAHEIFTSAVRKLEESYESLTYYVPCSLVAERTYPNFKIGPVMFVLCDEFFEQHREAIQKATAEFGGPETDKLVLGRMHSFYSEFQWVASITVPACDPNVSRYRAHEGIQKVLDVFKLIVGGERAAHVKQAYDVTVPPRYAELTSSASGSFSLRMGGKLHDAVTNDKWYEQVATGPAWSLLNAVLSNYWRAWHELGEIQNRFIDALGWHSDAISERDIGARIVKFWIAIERLLSTSAHSNITGRAAILASNDAEEFKTQAKRLESLYQRRSDIVHGAARRASESWYLESAVLSEKASKAALFGYLYSIRTIWQLPERTDRKKLTAWLTQLDMLARRFRTQS